MHRLKHLAFGALIALSTVAARAADTPAAPAQPVTAQLPVNAQDLVYLNTSLSVAASTCATNPDGCEIGRYKHLTDIGARLQAAAAEIQKKTQDQAAKAKK